MDILHKIRRVGSVVAFKESHVLELDLQSLRQMQIEWPNETKHLFANSKANLISLLERRIELVKFFIEKPASEDDYTHIDSETIDQQKEDLRQDELLLEKLKNC